MYRDKDGLMISETSPWPGSSGDSCANTARSEVLRPTGQSMDKFFTDTGCVRHPDTPWRESDFSGDQLIALFMAANGEQRGRLRQLFPKRAGDGNLHAPLTWAIMNNHFILANLFLLLQKLLFALPYRYSDADGLKWYQRLQRMDEASADYLNFFVAAVYMKRCGVLKINIDTEEVAHKVFHYYQNEPNNIEVLKDYEAGFNLIDGEVSSGLN